MGGDERTCVEPDCTRRHIARGLCALHYQRWAKANPNPGRPGPPKLYEDADWMRTAHHVRDLTLRAMAAEANCTPRTIVAWMEIHAIPIDRRRRYRLRDGIARYFPLCIPCHAQFDYRGGQANRKRGDRGRFLPAIAKEVI